MARRSSRSPPGVAMWVREMEGWSLIESPRSFRGDHWTLNIGILEFKVKEELTCDGRSTYVQGAPRLITDDDLHRSGIFARSNLVTTHNTKNMYIRNGRVLSIDICASIFTYREVLLVAIERNVEPSVDSPTMAPAGSRSPHCTARSNRW